MSADNQTQNMECLSMIVSAVAPKVAFGNSNQKTVKSNSNTYANSGNLANSGKNATVAGGSLKSWLLGIPIALVSMGLFTRCDLFNGIDNPDVPPVNQTDTVGKISQADADIIGNVQMHIAATGTTAIQDTMLVLDDGLGAKTAYKFEKIDENGGLVYKRYDAGVTDFHGVTGQTIFYAEDGIGKTKDYMFLNKDTLLVNNPEFIARITETEKYMDRIENGIKLKKLTPLEEAGKLTNKVITQAYNSVGTKGTLINLYNKALDSAKYIKK